MNPYTKRVTYSFEILGEDYSVQHFTDTKICIEEERKNGQEDTHFYGELNLADGRWVLDDESREHLEEYMSGEVADAIEAFFNEHGLPEPAQVKPVLIALMNVWEDARDAVAAAWGESRAMEIDDMIRVFRHEHGYPTSA